MAQYFKFQPEGYTTPIFVALLGQPQRFGESDLYPAYERVWFGSTGQPNHEAISTPCRVQPHYQPATREEFEAVKKRVQKAFAKRFKALEPVQIGDVKLLKAA